MKRPGYSSGLPAWYGVCRSTNSDKNGPTRYFSYQSSIHYGVVNVMNDLLTDFHVDTITTTPEPPVVSLPLAALPPPPPPPEFLAPVLGGGGGGGGGY